MNTASEFEHYTPLVLSYLNGRTPISPVPLDMKVESFECVFDHQKASFIAKLFRKVRDARVYDRTHQIDKAILQVKSSDDVSDEQLARIRLLKFHLAEEQEGVNWKDHIYLSCAKGHFHVSLAQGAMEHNGSKLDKNGITETLPPFIPGSGRFFQSPLQFGATGSPIATNSPHKLSHLLRDESGELQDTLVPDAYHSAYLFDPERACSGMLLALAHSFTTPFMTQSEQFKAAGTCKFAVKHAVRRLSEPTNSPEYFKGQLSHMVQDIASELLCKMQDNSGQVTLLAARAFLVGHNIRVVGVNIGDSMLIGWQPDEKRMIQLCKARKQANPNGEPTTALMPTAYNPATDMQIFDITVPSNTILLPLASGLTRYYDLQTNPINGNPNLGIELSLPADTINQLLATTNNGSECIRAIIQDAIFEKFRGRIAQYESFAMQAQVAKRELENQKEATQAEIYRRSDLVAQRKNALAERVKANGNTSNTEMEAEREVIRKEEADIKALQTNLEEQAKANQQAKYYTDGENMAIMALQMPALELRLAPQEDPEVEVLSDAQREEAERLEQVRTAVCQLLDETYNKEGHRNQDYIRNSQHITAQRIRNTRCGSLVDYANYLYCESLSLSGWKTPVTNALNTGLSMIQSYNPQRRWILTDQLIDEHSGDVLADPTLNRLLAQQLFEYIDSEETGFKYKAVTFLKSINPFSSDKKRSLKLHGQTARIQMAGSLAMRLLRCQCPEEYHQWMQAAQSVVNRLQDHDTQNPLYLLLKKHLITLNDKFPEVIEMVEIDHTDVVQEASGEDDADVIAPGSNSQRRERRRE